MVRGSPQLLQQLGFSQADIARLPASAVVQRSAEAGGQVTISGVPRQQLSPFRDVAGQAASWRAKGQMLVVESKGRIPGIVTKAVVTQPEPTVVEEPPSGVVMTPSGPVSTAFPEAYEPSIDAQRVFEEAAARQAAAVEAARQPVSRMPPVEAKSPPTPTVVPVTPTILMKPIEFRPGALSAPFVLPTVGARAATERLEVLTSRKEALPKRFAVATAEQKLLGEKSRDLEVRFALLERDAKKIERIEDPTAYNKAAAAFNKRVGSAEAEYDRFEATASKFEQRAATLGAQAISVEKGLARLEPFTMTPERKAFVLEQGLVGVVPEAYGYLGGEFEKWRLPEDYKEVVKVPLMSIYREFGLTPGETLVFGKEEAVKRGQFLGATFGEYLLLEAGLKAAAPTIKALLGIQRVPVKGPSLQRDLKKLFGRVKYEAEDVFQKAIPVKKIKAAYFPPPKLKFPPTVWRPPGVGPKFPSVLPSPVAPITKAEIKSILKMGDIDDIARAYQKAQMDDLIELGRRNREIMRMRRVGPKVPGVWIGKVKIKPVIKIKPITLKKLKPAGPVGPLTKSEVEGILKMEKLDDAARAYQKAQFNFLVEQGAMARETMKLRKFGPKPKVSGVYLKFADAVKIGKVKIKPIVKLKPAAPPGPLTLASRKEIESILKFEKLKDVFEVAKKSEIDILIEQGARAREIMKLRRAGPKVSAPKAELDFWLKFVSDKKVKPLSRKEILRRAEEINRAMRAEQAAFEKTVVDVGGGMKQYQLIGQKLPKKIVTPLKTIVTPPKTTEVFKSQIFKPSVRETTYMPRLTSPGDFWRPSDILKKRSLEFRTTGFAGVSPTLSQFSKMITEMKFPGLKKKREELEAIEFVGFKPIVPEGDVGLFLPEVKLKSVLGVAPVSVVRPPISITKFKPGIITGPPILVTAPRVRDLVVPKTTQKMKDLLVPVIVTKEAELVVSATALRVDELAIPTTALRVDELAISATVPRFRELAIQRTGIRTKELAILATAQRTLLQRITKPGRVIPRDEFFIRPPRKIPKVKIPPFLFPLPKEFEPTKRLKRFKKGFIPFARVKGKFIPLLGIPVTKEVARAYGAAFVIEKPARTFKLVPVTAPAYKVRAPAVPRGFMKMFRPAKTRELAGAFVEKAKFALREPTEYKEITLKGLQSLAMFPSLRKRKKKAKTKRRRKK